MLAVGLAGLAPVGLSGCASAADPRINTSQTPWQRPGEWLTAAQAEMTLATTYAAASTLVQGGADWCVAAATLHAAHAVVLTQPDPWGGYTVGPTPAPALLSSPTSSKDALDALTQAIGTASDAANAGLAKAAAGVEALLWASLQVCCDVDAAWCADPTISRTTPIIGSVVPSQITLQTSSDVAAAALDTLNTLVYTLSYAMGRIDKADPLYQDMATRLAQTNTLRDGLQAIIRSGGATPAPPNLNYPVPDGIDSSDVIKATWGGLEASLGQTYTRLAGTLGGGAAAGIATQAGDQLARATAMGQTISWWPGWA